MLADPQDLLDQIRLGENSLLELKEPGSQASASPRLTARRSPTS